MLSKAVWDDGGYCFIDWLGAPFIKSTTNRFGVCFSIVSNRLQSNIRTAAHSIPHRLDVHEVPFVVFSIHSFHPFPTFYSVGDRYQVSTLVWASNNTTVFFLLSQSLDESITSVSSSHVCSTDSCRIIKLLSITI